MPTNSVSDDSVITIVSLLPDLFGAYGDSGNATILAKRLNWRDIRAKVIVVESGGKIPETADIYVMGGGEDALQIQAVHELTESGSLNRAIDRGAVVLGICGGFQVLGRSFQSGDGSTHRGLGILDAESIFPDAPRAVGEILVEPDPEWNLPVLSGFENHSSHTWISPTAKRIGKVAFGTGAGWGNEGVINGHVLGTYMHGPVLARNPALADMLLTWAVGSALEALDDQLFERLRRERIDEVASGSRNPRRQLMQRFRRN